MKTLRRLAVVGATLALTLAVAGPASAVGKPPPCVDLNLIVSDAPVINGTACIDYIYAIALTGQTVNGSRGADKIFVVGDNVTVYAGDGADQVYVVGPGSHVYGGNGSDVLEGGGGADYIYGGNGDDTITGGGGSDTCSQGRLTTPAFVNAVPDCETLV